MSFKDSKKSFFLQKIDGKIKRINQENSTIKVWDDMRNNISGLSILSGQIYMYH